MNSFEGKITRRPALVRLIWSLALAVGAQATAGAAELAASASEAARFSMPAHELALDSPRSGGERFAVSASLTAKPVPKDVSWDPRFQMRATVGPKSLAAVSCGSDIFKDSFEN